MSHMVIYRDAEGRPGYQQSEALEDAVRYVETLRNEQGVEHARIFRMEEVTFEFKPYFRVEIGAAMASAPAPAPAAGPAMDPWAPEIPAAEPMTDVAEALAGEPAEAGAGANGRRGLFGR